MLPLFYSILIILLLPSSYTFASKVPQVILDVGHSPARPGAISPTGRKEFDYNVDLAYQIFNKLKNKGISVTYSLPENNPEAKLPVRAAKTSGTDLFVSIHHDSMPQEWIDQGLNKTLSGFSIFISQKNKFPVESYNCAQDIGYYMVSNNERPSLYHSLDYQGESKPLLSKEYGVHQFDNLIVLKAAQSPALLIEAGVITNPHEEFRLKKHDVIEQIADAITSGILSCVRKA